MKIVVKHVLQTEYQMHVIVSQVSTMLIKNQYVSLVHINARLAQLKISAFCVKNWETKLQIVIAKLDITNWNNSAIHVHTNVRHVVTKIHVIHVLKEENYQIVIVLQVNMIPICLIQFALIVQSNVNYVQELRNIVMNVQETE
jgi:hypothetical protein